MKIINIINRILRNIQLNKIKKMLNKYFCIRQYGPIIEWNGDYYTCGLIRQPFYLSLYTHNDYAPVNHKTEDGIPKRYYRTFVNGKIIYDDPQFVQHHEEHVEIKGDYMSYYLNDENYKSSAFVLYPDHCGKPSPIVNIDINTGYWVN